VFDDWLFPGLERSKNKIILRLFPESKISIKNTLLSKNSWIGGHNKMFFTGRSNVHLYLLARQITTAA
jgi:hypothetical protein